MRRSILCLPLIVFALIACKNSVNPNENKLGIKPSTLARIDTANYTSIEWQDTSIHLGKVKIGDTVIINYQFRNSGDKVLFILDAHSTCGCARIKYPEEAILPGKTGQVSATFKNKYQPGFVHQSIVVASNTRNGLYHILTFDGQVTDSARLNDQTNK